LRKLRQGLLQEGFEKVMLRYLLLFPEGSEIEDNYLRTRYAWSTEKGSQRIVFVIETSPERLDENFVHWGPPLNNPRLKEFTLKWGDKVRTDDVKKRAYVIQKRDSTDPEEIALKLWDGIKHGSRFESSTIQGLKKGEITTDILRALEGRFIPWS
jgi:hypothetical protein